MLKFQNNYTTLTENFEDFILLVYVTVYDLYKKVVPNSVSKRRNYQSARLSDSEVITIAVCGELIGIDSEKAWYSFVKKNLRNLFPNLYSRTRFNRIRRNLLQTTELIRKQLSVSFPIPKSPYYVIDSFSLAVCKFGRAKYCHAFRTDGENYGRCPSKKETYYGFKPSLLWKDIFLLLKLLRHLRMTEKVQEILPNIFKDQ